MGNMSLLILLVGDRFLQAYGLQHEVRFVEIAEKTPSHGPMRM